MRLLSSFFLGLLFMSGSAQIVINEVIFGTTVQVELKNLGSGTADAAPLFLCSFPVYTNIGAMNVISGELNMPGGSLLLVSGHNFNPGDDELGLYSLPDYDDPDDIIDYVEWGSTGHVRSGVAVAAGIWTAGDFVSDLGTAASLEYDGDGDMSSDWNPAANNSGGLENGSGECLASAVLVGNQNVCEGQCADFQIILGGEAPWVVQYSFNGDLQEPILTSEPIHVETWCQEGQYILVSVEDANCISEAQGFGSLNVQDFPTATIVDDGIICGTGPDSLEVALTGFGPWEIDFQENGIPAGSVTATSSPAYIPVGSQSTYTLIEVSDNFCEEGIVDGSVDVFFNGVDGGLISFLSSSDDTITVCVNDGISDNIQIITVGQFGDQQDFLLTESDTTIIGVEPSSTIDLEGSGPGFCSIWSLSYLDGLEGLDTATQLADLTGCFAVSSPLVVERDDSPGCITSIRDVDEIGFQLYPNPASDALFVEFGDAQVELVQVFDMSGRLVHSAQSLSNSRMSIDVSVLADGLYVLQLRGQNNSRGQRSFVIQH